MSLQLVVVTGPDQGRTFTVQPGPNLMLGRVDNCLYKLSDGRVSRSHCQILLQGDQVTAIDHNSMGGSFVNGKKIAQQVLELGDVLKIGDTELRLQMGDFPLDVALGAVAQSGQRPDAPANAVPTEKLGQLAALLGQKLAHYEIIHPIGLGGSSAVFFANDLDNDRPVALKVLHPEFSSDDEEMQRFIRGMKTAMPLRHPNLVTLYGAGKTQGFCWVAMEYVAGESLREVIKRIGVAGMLDWKVAFKVATHVGRALEYAHGQQIVHRNVTPENILLQATDKVAKLGDVMLAKALEGTLAKQITRPGELVGDVAYMSPERTRGLTELDVRSDLYALGATAYALLTGRPPFTGGTLVEKITKIRQAEPEKPTKFQLSIPSPFEGAVLKLLAKHPDQRYQSATDLLRELERIGKFSGMAAV